MEVAANNSLKNKIESLLARFPVLLQLARFVAIGVLNYSLDTIIFNLISKYFGIEHGGQLGLVNVPGFVAAVIQSYVWNHFWTFGQGQSVGLFKNFLRLFVVGLLGFLALVLILLGANFAATPVYYFILLASFVVGQIIMWNVLDLEKGINATFSKREFTIFIVVSVIGLLINSLCLAVASSQLVNSFHDQIGADLIKNYAKILATVVSLVWNFIGYKLFVFKK